MERGGGRGRKEICHRKHSIPGVRMIGRHKTTKERQKDHERVGHLIRQVESPEEIQRQQRTRDHVVTVLLEMLGQSLCEAHTQRGRGEEKKAHITAST